MPATSSRYRQKARTALIHTANTSSPTATDVAAACQTLRGHMARTLVTIFGAPAIDALFERSRRLATDEFQCLPELLPHGPGAKTHLLSNTASVADETSLDACAALLAHDISLLVNLVGEDLILPLVEKAWGPAGRAHTAGSESD